MDQRVVESSGWYAAAVFWLALVAAYIWYSARSEKQRWVRSGKTLNSLRTHRLRRLFVTGLMGVGVILLLRVIVFVVER